MLHRGVSNDEACYVDEPTSHISNSKLPAANPLPALTPPMSPRASPEAEEACGSVPQEPHNRGAAKSKETSETNTPREPLPELEKDAAMEESYGVPEKPPEEPEPCEPAPAPQPLRPDKPYSCSQCGKAYASRSGLKGHMKIHPGVLTNTPSKAQTNDIDVLVDRSSHSTSKLRGQQDERQGFTKSPEKGDSTDPPPISAGSDVTAKPVDTTE
uniref:zinc finger protein 628-like n=1 Tax=Monopterus albus TaxID=43700 RepID=UPI0009B431E4|nr:zinc finger protein 628-like [Monopterus albus]